MVDVATILMTARIDPLGYPFLAMKQSNVRRSKNLLHGDMSVITAGTVQHISCFRARESGREQIAGIEGSCIIVKYAEYLKILPRIIGLNISD